LKGKKPGPPFFTQKKSLSGIMGKKLAVFEIRFFKRGKLGKS
jgi:hypothetical protein